MAQALGKRVVAEASSNDEDRVSLIYRLCMGRDPRSPERDRLVQFTAAQKKAFAADPDAAELLVGDTGSEDKTAESERALTPKQLAELAAWTATARVMLNLDEFITRE
jgi:hypothetical protein